MNNMSITDDPMEGDQLHLLLSNCLNEKQLIETKQIFKKEGVTFEDLTQTGEQDLRELFNELQIKKLCSIRVINHLRTIPTSGVSKHPSNDDLKNVVVMTSEEKQSFMKLSNVYKMVSDATYNTQKLLTSLENNKTIMIKNMNETFINMKTSLERRQNEIGKQINQLALKKRNVLNEQLDNLTKYRKQLENAKKQYQMLFKNSSLSIDDRQIKSMEIVQSAINCNEKCDLNDEIRNNQIIFDIDPNTSKYIEQIGFVSGGIMAPNIKLVNITDNSCKLLIECDNKYKKWELKKYQVKYKIDDESKNNNDQKQIEMPQIVCCTNNEITIVKLKSFQRYLISARSIYEHFGASLFSKKLTFVAKQDLLWDRQNHGSNIEFIGNQRIKATEQYQTCIADYIVNNDEYYKKFAWTITTYQYSNYSHFGFIDANALPQDWNAHFVRSHNTNYSVMTQLNSTTLIVNGDTKVNSSVTCDNTRNGDKWKFIIDFERREVSVHQNERPLGVLWINVPFDRIVPAVSNNTASPAEFGISRAI
eukprot:112562_1